MSFSTSPAWGAGLATITNDDTVLDVWFPAGSLGLGAATTGGMAVLVDDAGLATMVGPRVLPGVRTEVVEVHLSSLADPPKDAADAYLRLHLLSHRLVRPHQANLEGIFGLLATVAWTSAGPCPTDRVTELRLLERGNSRQLAVYGVDKFPRMTDYVVPEGVRIGDADRVRLGAHLATGSTVMHEGFVNFNAGTLGASMVEGRISAGVVVGDGSDVGGGASIMGTLSGGGTEVISIGERCLIGANAGIGISLGDDCVVEAGCYITAGSKVTLPDGGIVRARELSGTSNLMLWRNSVTGALEARSRTGSGILLNPALHSHN
ncbi:2,3,4,5-tetrahydropyridine-2,6-dicarboxylate N-succinyltransferase [Natronosporangium hydrolyticum]|uniref:2,3,4,5-tetrahydropyridine-2,6-dicarboxylate N-succinyltransferase n=1 Tax=Natronosporangium hydrolyticum TaxID=2811111 RepID=A0A895YCU6_9ACTN|nr:2,3,4,5-tetrahydropyridine-2,6-dicarboxylate N-succinyltransferase [Natronosporangium hydrolyticum]QSB15644.1 2,3,4,5-tetrahydropyridine-2,6-dicarboxylate N-succinyltransferase [Natronosporangium hydrolyticum]